MPLYRATVKLARRSGIVKDQAINVWHFEATEIGTGSAAPIANALAFFYSAGSLPAYFAHTTDRTNTTPHSVDISVVAPGGPGPGDDVRTKSVHLLPFSMVSVGATAVPLPAEVAVALSFRGDIAGQVEEAPDGTRPASRRRGRIFLGPLNGSVVSQDSLGRAFVATEFRSVVNDAYQTMMIALNAASPTIYHVVYSPTAGSNARVSVLSMDDAFDTIRNRGEAATERTTWEAGQL